jgi:DNA-binding transcriptional ArsR family regulator
MSIVFYHFDAEGGHLRKSPDHAPTKSKAQSKDGLSANMRIILDRLSQGPSDIYELQEALNGLQMATVAKSILALERRNMITVNRVGDSMAGYRLPE